MITCFLRYFISPGKEKEFEEYGRRWNILIEKFGGIHLGYFVPEARPEKHFSFPGLGSEGPQNVGVAIYSFPDLEAYNTYRKLASEDVEVKAVTQYFNDTKCFTNYERTFVRRVDSGG